MKFIILASSYNENIGGIIASHKLCHHLNDVGYEAFLYPISRSSYSFRRRIFADLTSKSRLLRSLTGRGFRMNPALKTKLLPLSYPSIPEDAVVIYGDTIAGNPLNAKNVVRWFLHKPGHHTGVIEHGSGELHIDFDEFLSEYDPQDNFLSPDPLHIVHYPVNIYNGIGATLDEGRSGIAYCVRKGSFVDGLFDRKDATCIDGLSHEECASVFKRVERFYSFDPYTAYSSFAALCGAISIVIPPENMTKSDWYEKDSSRLGIAFGESDIAWARETMPQLHDELIAREKRGYRDAIKFTEAAADFFNLPIYSWSKHDF